MRAIAYASASLGTQAVLACISVFVPPLFAARFGAGATAIGAVLAAGPLMGIIVQSWAASRSRALSVLMCAGILIAALALALLSLASTPATAAVALLVVFAAFHAFAGPYRASMGATIARADRTRISALQAAAKGAGALSIVALGSQLVTFAPALPLPVAAALLLITGLCACAATRPHEPQHAGVLHAMREVIAAPAMRRMMLAHALCWFALHAVFAFTVLYAVHELLGVRELASAEGRAATALASRVLALFALTGIVTAPLCARFAKRMKPARVLLAGLASLALGLTIALFAHDFRAAYGVAVLGGAGFASVQTIPYPMLLERVSADREGAFAAAFNATIEVPQLLSLAMTGLLIDAFGTYRVAYALALIAVAAAFFILVRADALRAERCSPAALSDAELDELWVFFSRFVARDRPAFEANLFGAGELTRFRDADERLRGFVVNTITREHDRIVIYTLYAAFDPEVRGSNLSQREGLRCFIREKLTYPFTPCAWLFTASTYKSYLLLPRNFVEYWPRPDHVWPDREAALVQSVMMRAQDPGWDEATGVIRRNGKSRYLEGVVADETSALADADIRFYAKMNPGQVEGDTLICFAPLSPANVGSIVRKMAARMIRSRR